MLDSCQNPSAAPPMKATHADTLVHSVKEKSAEEAELLAVLRTFIYAKMKSSIRLMSFKMFKPRSQTMSGWKNMIKKEAAEKNMTLGQLVQNVMRGEGFVGIARRYLPSYIGTTFVIFGILGMPHEAALTNLT